MKNTLSRIALSLVALGSLTSAGAAPAVTNGEYAVYSDGGNAIAVIRNHGDVQLLWCNAPYFPEDKPTAEAAKEFALRNCQPAPVTELTYISGKTSAVASVAQVYVHPANSAQSGEVSSVMSTYLIKTWPQYPVGAGDTIVYTGAKIVHDHMETPRLSTVRITYKLIGVTRAN